MSVTTNGKANGSSIWVKILPIIEFLITLLLGGVSGLITSSVKDARRDWVIEQQANQIHDLQGQVKTLETEKSGVDLIRWQLIQLGDKVGVNLRQVR